MKKLIPCLAFLMLPAMLRAQNNRTESNPGSIVVSRYDADMTEIPASGMNTIPEFRKWGFALDFGYSYRVGKVVSGPYHDFYKKMRSGIAYGADIHYYLSRGLGLGLRYTGHHYSHSDNRLSDKVTTNYFAPSFHWRNLNRSENGAFVLGFSLGYVHYSEKPSIIPKIDKGGVGSTVDVGYDFRLSGNLFLGLKLTFTGGRIKMDTMPGNTEDVYESLNALDFGVGLRF